MVFQQNSELSINSEKNVFFFQQNYQVSDYIFNFESI